MMEKRDSGWRFREFDKVALSSGFKIWVVALISAHSNKGNDNE